MRLSRRAMVRDGMLAVSAGMVMPAVFSRGLASAKALTMDNAHASLAASDHTLIVVQMAGGNDGLNTVIPYTDPTYLKMRPTLAIPQNKVLTLDNRLGLHPNLTPLRDLWDKGHIAIGGYWLSQSKSLPFPSYGYLADARSRRQRNRGLARQTRCWPG